MSGLESRSNFGGVRRGRDDGDLEPTTAIEPAPHELSANLIFTAHGLSPYYALDATVKDAGGSDSAVVELDGERYDLTLYYQESGLEPWDSREFQIETVREFRIKFEAANDSVGERGGTFHVSPRWPDMESKGDGPNPSTPDIIGVNVRVDGSNIPAGDYPELLRRGMDAFGIDAGYFAESKVHDYSNVFQYEKYVRISRDKSEQVIGRGGPLEQIFEHVETEADFRELREDDRELQGYHHRVKFDSEAADSLLSGHTYGKKVKHYHPENPRDDASSPLYHPKVGVSLQSNLTVDTVRWADLDDLGTELDELLINLLSWAGLSTREGETYVSDAYFEATESPKDIRLVDNPLPEIKRKQETTVVDGLTANPDLNQSDRDVVELMADGGRRDVDDVATESDYSKRTVYRVVNRLDDILSKANGVVRFKSNFIGKTVRGTLSELRETLESVGESAGDSVGAFRKWANAHGVEVDDSRSARLTLRFGRVPDGEDMTDILRDGWRAWIRSGRNGRRFKSGKAEYQQSGFPTVREPLLR